MAYNTLLNPIIPGQPRGGDAPEWRWMYAEAVAERAKITDRYDEASGFALPGRQGFSRNPDEGQQYDDTAIQAVPEFSSTIQQGIMPNYARWASHMAGVLIEDPEEAKALSIELEKVDHFIFDLINSSNTQTEVNESLIDLALGTGMLRLDEGLGTHPLNCRSVPQRAFCFTVGVDGQPDAVFEERWLTLSQIDVDYPDTRIPDGIEAEKDRNVDAAPTKYRVIEAWRKDWTNPKAQKKHMALLFPDHKWHVGYEEEHTGAGCSPYIGPFRWSKGSGEAWGRGPLFNILPSLRTVNFAMSALLEHSDFALAGIWTIEDDGAINVDTVRLEPGTVIPKAPGSEGLKNVNAGGRFDMQQFMLEEMRKNIKRALYADQLGDPERSPKTATEVTQRMAALSRAIGSSFGRLVIELAVPFIQRTVYILKQKGLIKLPTVDGKNVALLPSSPLARSQDFDDIDGFDRFSGLVQSRFGPESVPLEINQQEAVPWLAERFGIPARLLNSMDKKQEGLQIAEEAIAEQQGPPIDTESGIPEQVAGAPGF